VERPVEGLHPGRDRDAISGSSTRCRFSLDSRALPAWQDLCRVRHLPVATSRAATLGGDDRDHEANCLGRPARQGVGNRPIVDGRDAHRPVGRGASAGPISDVRRRRLSRARRPVRKSAACYHGRACDRRAGRWTHAQGVESRRAGRVKIAGALSRPYGCSDLAGDRPTPAARPCACG